MPLFKSNQVSSIIFKIYSLKILDDMNFYNVQLQYTRFNHIMYVETSIFFVKFSNFFKILNCILLIQILIMHIEMIRNE